MIDVKEGDKLNKKRSRTRFKRGEKGTEKKRE